MRIGILGAGAMGSLLAARLALAGESVVLLARPSAHVVAVREGRLRVERSGTVELAVKVPVALEPREAGRLDAVVVLVKRWSTREAVGRFAPAIPRDALVVTLQNGLDAREDLAAAFPNRPPGLLVAGVTSQAAMLPEPGAVRHTGEGPTLIASDPPGVGAAAGLATVLDRCGWPTAVVADIGPAVWRKLAVNAAINGITALAGVPNGALVERDDLRRLAERVAREVEAVAHAAGIDITGAAADTIRVARATAANRSSMLQDIERGRPTEVAAIHGAAVRRAAAAGVDVPLLGALAALIRARETGGSTPPGRVGA